MVSHEEASQRVASHFEKPWLRHYTASKLRSDPAFAAVYEALRATTLPILDVGCGVGLLPFYLRERGLEQPITGFDIDARKIRSAQAVGKASYRGRELTFFEHDVRNHLPDFSGNIAVLDLLHYLSPERQKTLLAELSACVSPGGLLLLRDCPRDGSARYWATYAGEKFAQAISWNVGVPLHFPARESINAAFPEAEFTREEQPAWGGTPFNNRLFVFRRRV
jgi:2-polyprenyl-3-methyl-5-hydroxy-6-metoxy-1,4-benzoquinol methylase